MNIIPRKINNHSTINEAEISETDAWCDGGTVVGKGSIGLI